MSNQDAEQSLEALYPILSECTRTKTGCYMHNKCGQLLDRQRVIHPIWLEGTTGGYGETAQEIVPYCGTCGTAPSTQGAPVYYKQIG